MRSAYDVEFLLNSPLAKPELSLKSISFQAQRLGDSFKELLDKDGNNELPVKEMANELMTNTIKDDISVLPRIYPPEYEYELSSIFVDTMTSTVSQSFIINHCFCLFPILWLS